MTSETLKPYMKVKYMINLPKSVISASVSGIMQAIPLFLKTIMKFVSLMTAIPMIICYHSILLPTDLRLAMKGFT